MDVGNLAARVQGLHGVLADAIGNPDRVWCRECGRSEAVDAARCFRDGWPKCCGATMTIDRPGDARD
jgi:hypothetical protein